MTFPAPGSVPSGVPLPVVAVDGRQPSTLSEFAAETSFAVQQGGVESQIFGLGAMREGAVRFHQKDVDHRGRDVRVWQISQDEHGFVALPLASF